MDDSSGSGFVLVQNTTFTSNNIISPLLKGKIYRFKVTARNVFGESPDSSIVSALCATVPTQMTSPVVSQVSKNVRITWIAPNNNGAIITSYKVYL